MKKNVFRLIYLTGIVLLASACGNDTGTSENDESWEKVEEEGQLTVATSGTLFPASYYNADNELTGYDIEVAKEVADRLGVGIEFKEFNVDGQTASLINGEADLAANDFSLTEDRAENFSLSDPIKYSFTSMIVRESDDSGIESLEDLEGKKAAGEPNTSYMNIAEQYGAELVTYDNATNDQYLADVANGRTDVVINDYYLQTMAVGALPDIPVKILEDLYFNADYSGLLMLRSSEALKEKVDDVLKEMQDDGTLSSISEEFFQADVSIEPDVEIEETVSAE